MHPERENPGYAYEKRVSLRLTLVWGPQMVNPALVSPGAATDGVTLFFYIFPKKLTTFFVVIASGE